MMYFLITLALLSLLFIRPMALGNGYSIYGIVAFFLISTILYVGSRNKENAQNLINIQVLLNILYFVIPLELFFLFLGGDPRGTFTCFCTLLSCALLFNSKEKMRFFFNCYCWLIFVLCVSSIITSILLFIVDNVRLWHTMKWGEISFPENRFGYEFYFPFTVTQMRYIINSTVVMRCNHFFGEPGIAPCFITAAILHTINDKTLHFRLTKIIVYILGIFVTYSTTGAAVLFAGLGTYYLFSGTITLRKLICFIIIGMIGLFLFLYLPGFGLMEKSQSAIYAGNVSSRYRMLQNPFKIMATLMSLIIYSKVIRYKENRAVFSGIFFSILLGSLANIIFFSSLYNVFLFYDSEISNRNEYR